MAVCAAHLALLDLGEDGAPRIPTSSQEANAGPFTRSVDVIAVKNDGIALAAIDTWMLGQVVP